jgi:hypothetical protein
VDLSIGLRFEHVLKIRPSDSYKVKHPMPSEAKGVWGDISPRYERGLKNRTSDVGVNDFPCFAVSISQQSWC